MTEERRRRSMPPRSSRAGARTKERTDRIAMWWQRIQFARQLRHNWEIRYSVDKLASTYLGDEGAHGLDLNDNSEITINRFWPTIKAMLPGLMSQNPTFLIRPVPKSAKPVDIDQALLAQGVLDAIARQDQHLKHAAQLAILQAFFRVGILKAVYDPTTERNPRRGEPMYVMGPGGAPLRDQFSDLPVQATDPETGELMVEPAEVVKDEVYEWRWVNAANMLFPDDGPDMRRWKWIAEEITVTLEEAKDDERFPKSLRDQLTPNAAQREGRQQEMPLALGTPEPDEMVTYIEIWDAKQNTRMILSEGQTFANTEFLVDEDVPGGVENHPYAVLAFNPVTDPKPSPWPVPVTWNWLQLQQEYTLRRRQMIAAAGRSARKIFYDDSTFPDLDEAEAGLSSSRDLEAVKVNDTHRPPVTIPDPSSPPDITRDLLALTEDWRVVTGQTGARLSNPDSDTATEAIFSERAANLRDVEMRQQVQDWLGTAGRKMLQRLKATLTLEMMVKLRGFSDREFQDYVGRVYGANVVQRMQFFPGLKQLFLQRFGQEKWTRVSREDLQFEADVTVTPGSARARSLDMERQQMLAFVRIIAQFPHVTLSRELMRMMGDLFEFVGDSLIDELHVLGRQLMQARQGALQGAAQTPGGQRLSAPGGGSPVVASNLARALGGNAGGA